MKTVVFSNVNGTLNHEFTVTLLPSRRAFLRYLRTKTCVFDGVVKTSSGAGAAAMCRCLDVYETGLMAAELVFYQEHFNIECIAHEVTHALLTVFRRHNRSVAEDEELFARLHGKMTQAVWNWKQEIGL